jgi:membrane-associated phospholipid phosphatase
VHYSFVLSVIFFVFLIFPASFLIKIPILAVFITCFLVPLTSQFFIHALPIFSWLALFFLAGKIPVLWKPAISVKVLPATETIFYGDNLSNVLATFNTTLLDLFAWLPYGIIHFSAPFVVALLIFLLGPPTGLQSFGFAFGYMNLLGVMTQILFPAAPPWYKLSHGLEPANYLMSGSPGGLGRIDAILGVDMYTSNFSNAPVVFGAFPSLHSGMSVMDALFLCWLFPKYKVVWWAYAVWLWWSTMYLTHHYFIDLIGGAVLSYVVFTYSKYTHLPIMDPTKFCRWSYTEIHKVDIRLSDPLTMNFNEDTENTLRPYLFLPASDNIEMAPVTRSRQQLRSLVPTMQNNSAKSSSLLNLAIAEETHDAEVLDSSSLEYSAAPLVFDEEQHQSLTASTTSLDDELASRSYKDK